MQETVPAIDENLMFTYWDSYYGPLPRFDRSLYKYCFRVLPRDVTNPIDDKGQLGEILNARSDLFPLTFSRPADIPYIKAHPEGLWFVKNRHGAGGKQVSCHKYRELENIRLQPNDVLQQALVDVDLINGRKYTIRCYLLIWNGQCYLHRHWYKVIHGEAYDRNSTDYAVQVSLRYSGGGTEFAAVTPALADESEQAMFAELKRSNTKIIRELPFLMAESDREQYTILGCDFVVEANSRAKLIEINAYPNLVHLDHSVANEVIYPMIRDTVSTLVSNEVSECWEPLS
ncbi:MAG: hypothetical protein RIC17_04570 [Gammaproteobacteria bacterium]